MGLAGPPHLIVKGHPLAVQKNVGPQLLFRDIKGVGGGFDVEFCVRQFQQVERFDEEVQAFASPQRTASSETERAVRIRAWGPYGVVNTEGDGHNIAVMLGEHVTVVGTRHKNPVIRFQPFDEPDR